MIRDRFKDKEYFDKDIERVFLFVVDQKKDTEELKIKLKDQFPLVNYYMVANGIYLYIKKAFSRGDDVSSLVSPCKEMLNYYAKSISLNDDYSDGGDIIYTEFLGMISLGVLLDTKEELEEIYRLIGKINYDDYLIDFILNNVYPNAQPSENLLWPDDVACKKLKSLTLLPKIEAEGEMKDYLEKYFYTKENFEDEYNAHKKNHSGYCGYWSWEAGAVTKIMGLDDNSYKDNPYYPYDIVHWQN